MPTRRRGCSYVARSSPRWRAGCRTPASKRRSPSRRTSCPTRPRLWTWSSRNSTSPRSTSCPGRPSLRVARVPARPLWCTSMPGSEPARHLTKCWREPKRMAHPSPAQTSSRHGSRRAWTSSPKQHDRRDAQLPMRKVIVSTYVTLDGRVDEIQNWAVPYDDDEAVSYHTDLLMNSDGLLLGRKTYEIFGANSRERSGESPYIDRINSMPKYVASTTLKDLEWENSHLIEGDVPAGVAKLKEEPGQPLVIYGCRDLMHSLLE